MPTKLLNMERIIKAIGTASYLSNRSAPYIINNMTLLWHSHSCKRKYFQHLRTHTALDIKPSSWLIISKAIQHIQRMLYLCPAWKLSLAENRLACTMADSCMTVKRLSSPWSSHPEFLNEPKGIKAVLSEWGLFHPGLSGKCQKCEDDKDDCCKSRSLQFRQISENRSLSFRKLSRLQVICAFFLPKFHCELNFIEFFWGSMKKYLHDNCDFTFNPLKDNMPKALALVQLKTTCLWEHHMQRWMEAYCSGLGTTEAQCGLRCSTLTSTSPIDVFQRL